MSKPDDIPQDVWDVAETTANQCGGDLAIGGVETIARAILAERKRCAKVAESRVPLWEEAEAIAAAIWRGDLEQLK